MKTIEEIWEMEYEEFDLWYEKLSVWDAVLYQKMVLNNVVLDERGNITNVIIDNGKVKLSGKFNFVVSRYRIRPEPKPPEYVPFTIEDADMFKGKWIKEKGNAFSASTQIIGYDIDGIFIIDTNLRPIQYFVYEQGKKSFVFDDGTPFGKVKV